MTSSRSPAAKLVAEVKTKVGVLADAAKLAVPIEPPFLRTSKSA